MSSHADKLRRLWDAWSRGSIRDITELLHPDVEWESMALGRRYHGHGDVAEWLDGLRREWKSLTVSFDRAEDVAPGVAVAYGRASGFDYGGGQTFDTPITWVAEFDDGLIVRGRAFSDEQAARAFLASLEAGGGRPS